MSYYYYYISYHTNTRCDTTADRWWRRVSVYVMADGVYLLFLPLLWIIAGGAGVAWATLFRGEHVFDTGCDRICCTMQSERTPYDNNVKVHGTWLHTQHTHAWRTSVCRSFDSCFLPTPLSMHCFFSADQVYDHSSMCAHCSQAPSATQSDKVTQVMLTRRSVPRYVMLLWVQVWRATKHKTVPD